MMNDRTSYGTSYAHRPSSITASDVARYNTKFRNPALSHLSAERLYILYTAGGLEGVRAQVMRLHHRGII
jgi:hypothetical protein